MPICKKMYKGNKSLVAVHFLDPHPMVHSSLSCTLAGADGEPGEHGLAQVVCGSISQAPWGPGGKKVPLVMK